MVSKILKSNLAPALEKVGAVLFAMVTDVSVESNKMEINVREDLKY